MFYKDNLLDGSFLIYKPNSSDTLMFGNYKLDKKDGEWKCWSADSNHLDRIEIYENGILKETKKQ